ncbi:MAG TPA: isoprenyl transferase [Chlamydiales bacterium]|nr:isoprenyl transferase [Chlamydiales bacterium]
MKESELDHSRIPEHIAIMMDGNRRWAKRKGLPILHGHYQGAETLDRIVTAAIDLGIKTLTVYAFSTENWSRALNEVKGLMSLLKVYLLTKREKMKREGVQLDTIGDLSRLPKRVNEILDKTKEITKEGNKLRLVLALNYGARSEITRAFTRMLDDYQNKKFTKEKIDEEMIGRYLDTQGRKDPELLIRPSGEIRVSNFLLWQISYSEIHFTDVLWPDFTKSDLIKAIADYQKREKRLGG